jgi:hypothetical protein
VIDLIGPFVIGLLIGLLVKLAIGPELAVITYPIPTAVTRVALGRAVVVVP